MKKIIKTIILALLLVIALALLTVGPLYNIKISQEVIQVPQESTEVLEEGTEPEVTYIETTKDVVLGEKVLSILGLQKLNNNYYLQTVSSVASGLIFGFIICFIIKSSKKKAKKDKRKNTQDKGPDNSLKVNFPNPTPQNMHKKNNITF